MFTILQKAPRDENGRVPGVSPPRLSHTIVHWMSVQQQVEMQEIAYRFKELTDRRKTLYASMGLDPRESYKFNNDGTVVIMGKHTAHY